MSTYCAQHAILFKRTNPHHWCFRVEQIGETTLPTGKVVPKWRGQLDYWPSTNKLVMNQQWHDVKELKDILELQEWLALWRYELDHPT